MNRYFCLIVIARYIRSRQHGLFQPLTLDGAIDSLKIILFLFSLTALKIFIAPASCQWLPAYVSWLVINITTVMAGIQLTCHLAKHV